LLEPVDLVLVEGYKRDAHPKVEAHRAQIGNPLIARDDASVVAIASDVAIPDITVPVFDLDDVSGVADFILAAVGLTHGVSGATPDLKPPRLSNDCFSLPRGVDWVPVDEALVRLRAGLTPVVDHQTRQLEDALERVLAHDVIAARANPPAANAAVDGYGFAHVTLPASGDPVLPLLPGRAAAGAPFAGVVPAGRAVRIMTGALLPDGVDTVVLQEDVNADGGFVAFGADLRAGANTRHAGEDVEAGAVVLGAGQRIGPPELALAAAVGVRALSLCRRLRVGVLSTGDEIVTPHRPRPPDKTYDANRPMLLAVAAKWGYEPVDLGHVGDDRVALGEALDAAAAGVDVILTSGGASAGEEDHVSALLAEAGALNTWRIAMKPGRPLALGLWHGVPVFGLPGNPVAALICTLVFARPAMSVLAGGAWLQAQGFDVPASFEKRKKAGRREYLRARIGQDGRVTVFASEGSGRISGLSWADGLVELGDGARHVRPGDVVRYVPYASFGL
ncbi:MAG: gephyrin-like molybdotransferase Glp, partial [Paracoccaceae bacterium]